IRLTFLSTLYHHQAGDDLKEKDDPDPLGPFSEIKHSGSLPNRTAPIVMPALVSSSETTIKGALMAILAIPLGVRGRLCRDAAVPVLGKRLARNLRAP